MHSTSNHSSQNSTLTPQTTTVTSYTDDSLTHCWQPQYWNEHGNCLADQTTGLQGRCVIDEVRNQLAERFRLLKTIGHEL
jgi:hypothetical protein